MREEVLRPFDIEEDKQPEKASKEMKFTITVLEGFYECQEPYKQQLKRVVEQSIFIPAQLKKSALEMLIYERGQALEKAKQRYAPKEGFNPTEFIQKHGTNQKQKQKQDQEVAVERRLDVTGDARTEATSEVRHEPYLSRRFFQKYDPSILTLRVKGERNIYELHY